MSEASFFEPFEQTVRATGLAVQSADTYSIFDRGNRTGTFIERYHAYLTERTGIDPAELTMVAKVPVNIRETWLHEGLEIVAPLVFAAATVNRTQADLRVYYADYQTGAYIKKTAAYLGKIVMNRRNHPGAIVRSGFQDYYTDDDVTFAVKRQQQQIRSGLIRYASWVFLERFPHWPEPFPAK